MQQVRQCQRREGARFGYQPDSGLGFRQQAHGQVVEGGLEQRGLLTADLRQQGLTQARRESGGAPPAGLAEHGLDLQQRVLSVDRQRLGGFRPRRCWYRSRRRQARGRALRPSQPGPRLGEAVQMHQGVGPVLVTHAQFREADSRSRLPVVTAG